MTETISQGYKQTEIGIIPEDWEDKRLDEVFSITAAGDLNKETFSKMKDEKHPYPIYSNSLSNKGIYGYSSEYRYKENSVTITARGSLGVAFPRDHKFDAIIRVLVLSPITKLNCYFVAEYINQRVQFSIESTGVPQLTSPQVSRYKIAFPKYEEQNAIAEILISTDELIQKLDKLISKKKDIKKGAMQELLTGKKRLPGFSGEWEECLFSNIIELNKGQQLNRSSLTEKGEYPAWNGGIEPSGYTDKCNAKANTITISEGGNSCGFVNYCTTDFWCGGHCYALRILNSSTDKSYLYNLLKFKEPQIMSLRIGSGLPNIQKKNLYEFELKIPKDPEEQSAIAKVLSDMDSEIEELEQKRDKYRMIKEGMMQQLLTGGIRLKWK